MTEPKLTPAQIRRAMSCAAKCDAIVTEEEWLRAYWYEEDWGDGITMAKYDNGSGDHAFVFFNDDGSAIIKGFDHESGVSPHAQDEYAVWPGLYEGVPQPLMQLLEDESVEHEDVTFCFWSVDGQTWLSGNAAIPEELKDGSNWLLSMIQVNADEFIEWGQSYYEDDFEKLGVDGVRNLFQNNAR